MACCCDLTATNRDLIPLPNRFGNGACSVPAAHRALGGGVEQDISGQVRPLREVEKHRPDVGDDLPRDFGRGCGSVRQITRPLLQVRSVVGVAAWPCRWFPQPLRWLYLTMVYTYCYYL